MVAVIVVGIDGCDLVAWDISFLQELLDRNSVFLTIHIADHEDRNRPEFSLYDLSLSKNQPDLCGAGHGAAWLSLVALPPEMCADQSIYLFVRLSLEDSRSEGFGSAVAPLGRRVFVIVHIDKLHCLRIVEDRSVVPVFL